jgi:hypothetical protein
VCVDDSYTLAVQFGSVYRVVGTEGEFLVIAESRDIPMLPVRASRLRRPEELPMWGAVELARLRGLMSRVSGLLPKSEPKEVQVIVYRDGPRRVEVLVDGHKICEVACDRILVTDPFNAANYTEGSRGDFTWPGDHVQTRQWNAEKRQFEEHRGYSV